MDKYAIMLSLILTLKLFLCSYGCDYFCAFRAATQIDINNKKQLQFMFSGLKN